MELTQRLECTQDLFNSKNEKTSPEQIGFLGICGTKYPLKKGPNKIGRDPESCNIVLNLNSISRQHAVINILNSQDFMLMDLDSANKTKLSDKTLQAYIPYPLKNGDMVQFGQVFGVFRLIEEENDLPMTQAIEIPETPVPIRHCSKLNNVHTTTIPESPDVSDRDDSFIASSQHKAKNVFKSPNNNFLISAGKTISIKPVGTNKIDNVYWSSSKKSDSFTTQSDVSGNLNDSVSLTSHASIAKQSIHELNTQINSDHNENLYSNNNTNTQITENAPSPNIYDMETQMPVSQNLPEVLKIKDQQNLAFNYHADNKENDNKIFNTDTQVTCDVKSGSPKVSKYLNEQTKMSTSGDSHNVSDDVILFDEIDSQPIQDEFFSQPILSPKLNLTANDNKPKSEEKHAQPEKISFVPETKTNQLDSDCSTDCEDIFMVMTQVIPKATDIDENSTDCEDKPSLKLNKNPKHCPVIDDDVTDCEDELNENDVIQPNKPLHDDRFEDLPTQIIEDAKVDDIHEVIDPNCFIEHDSKLKKTPMRIVEDKNESLNTCKGIINIDNVSKQQFHPESQKNTDFAEALTQQIYSEEIVKFKVPFQSPFKKKKSHDVNTNINKCTTTTLNVDEHDDQYYNATQELFNDLCSQRTLSPEVKIVNISSKNSDKNQLQYKEQNIKVNTRISRQDAMQPDASDVEERIDNFVSNLSCSQIREVVGVQTDPIIKKRVSSDTSDLEMTPKKINCRSILDTHLPNTQEIKNATLYSPDTSDTESSCESNESESNNERDIPKRLHQKPKRNSKIKINLSEKFDPASLPVRSSSRLKKPTEKVQNIDALKKTYENKPKARSHKKQQSESIKISKDNTSVTEKSNGGTNKISNNNYSKTNVKNPDKTVKNDKDEKIDKKNDKELSRSMVIKDSRTDKSKQTDNVNINKRKSKSIETVTEERNNEQNLSTGTDRKMRSRKNNVHNITEDEEKSKVDNKTKLKDNRKPIKEAESKEDKENSKSELKSRVKKPSKDVENHEPEVRRSKRNRSGIKSESSSGIPKTKSTGHEQSVVYSNFGTSSDSGTDSPNRLKRLATKEFEMPNAKKSKSGVTNCKSSSYRATPARKVKTHYVLFTAFACDEVKDKLEALGATVVSDVMTCTVVLTLQIKRTFKLLCAVGLGKPIVGPNWVQACADTNMIVDPWLYLINDEATEKRFQFNLQRTLVGKRDFLKGYSISSTPSVMPSAAEMKLIVECSGGNWKEGRYNWICVSAPADRALWAGLKRKGAVVVSTEFILGGVLRQKLEIDKNKLI